MGSDKVSPEPEAMAAGEMALAYDEGGSFVERGFETLGRGVSKHAAPVIGAALVVMIALSSGFSSLEAESRPEKQWVAEGSTSLVQNAYVKSTWPSNQRMNFLAAKCRGTGCNIFEAKYIQRLALLDSKLKAIVIDGDKLVAEWDGDYKENQPAREWNKYAGTWSFDSGLSPANRTKCFKWGPYCGQSGLLDMFPAGAPANDTAALAAIHSKVASGTVLSKIAGGIVNDGSGNAVSATAIFGTYSLSLEETFIEKTGRRSDPLAMEWEAAALCVLGVDADDDDAYTNCVEDDLLDIAPQFARSWSDEFGSAIKGDVAKLGAAYMLMLGYLMIMLSRCDPAHSMIGMSFVVIIIVGFSFAGCMGVGSFIGLYNNSLNNNIPFLLLGLGVDDAFVLVSEFQRATKLNPSATVDERIGLAMKTGGMSVLITSATDALAFMVGSMTVLPALSWFCMFAGIGVVLCFFLQIFLFMPCLAINARRAEANRLDILCCITDCADERPEDKPRGCCSCCGSCCLCSCCLKPGKLADFFGGPYAKFITSNVGIGITLAFFSGLFAVGVAGTGMIYKDFKLEWFIPSDSYVQDFIKLNDDYFKSGKTFAIYTPDIDYFTKQSQVAGLSSYLASGCPYLERSAGATKDWAASFVASSFNTNIGTASLYYAAVHNFLDSSGGSSFRTSLKFHSAPCDDYSGFGAGVCDTSKGIEATRLSGTIDQKHVLRGTDRYNAMVAMRADVEKLMPGSFPFNFEFLYWEEVGVIDEELTRNLLICGVVVLVMVGMLIPVPRISLLVTFCICVSILDVVGFLYFWDVTISGVSTIYILICVGLAVDYAAHTAHMFKDSTGDSRERARKSLGRIGPSVFNAIISTLLAVVVIGFSKSYVFIVFFKAFFLVTTIAGAHGIWLLPCLLGLFGGDNLETAGVESVRVRVDDKKTPEGVAGV